MRRTEITILAGVMLLGGCATKRYVADRVDPVNAKVGEVDQRQQNTQKQLDEAETKINAADEKATSADARAGDAIGLLASQGNVPRRAGLRRLAVSGFDREADRNRTALRRQHSALSNDQHDDARRDHRVSRRARSIWFAA